MLGGGETPGAARGLHAPRATGGPTPPGACSQGPHAVGAYNGEIGDFACGNDGDNGGTEGQILVSGVMTDEYIDVETFPTRIEYDSRAISERNGTLTAVYFNLHKARIALEGAASVLQ